MNNLRIMNVCAMENKKYASCYDWIRFLSFRHTYTHTHAHRYTRLHTEYTDKDHTKVSFTYTTQNPSSTYFCFSFFFFLFPSPANSLRIINTNYKATHTWHTRRIRTQKHRAFLGFHVSIVFVDHSVPEKRGSVKLFSID